MDESVGVRQRIAAATIVTPEGLVGPAEVVVDDGRIAEINAVDDAPDRILCPGFIDLQVNGIGGVDVATADGTDWDDLDVRLLAQGVTTWCPTLVSAPLAHIDAALERVVSAAARGGLRPHIA